MRALRLAFLPALAAASLAAAPEAQPEKPTLGVRPPAGSIVLFDGKSSRGWVKADGKTPADWPVEDGVLDRRQGQGVDQDREDVRRRPAPRRVQRPPTCPTPRARPAATAASTSTGAYELQVLDSYGLKPQDNDCGAIYKQVTPRVNACKPPLQWQTYDITFHKAEVERRQGRQEGPRSPSSRTASRSSTTPRSRPRPAASAPRKATTARSCSRTTATTSSSGTSGSKPL